ncbi:MAG: TAT-variant-translocated molybdopterin oxidoreductase [Chloroflexaceae bacterium]|nr:TAT-variant-translocated molybdopterin oxidoreductase [Chloroflexaceae bacterium]
MIQPNDIAVTPARPVEDAAAKQMRLADFRARVEQLRGKRRQAYWRGLEELAATPEFAETLHREFPRGPPSGWTRSAAATFSS